MSALLERWTGLVLLHPGFLWLLAAIPLALLSRRWRGRPTVRFGPGMFLDPAGSERVPRSFRQRLVALPAVLGSIGIALAIVALARPVDRVPLPPRTEGIDILLCLDTSSSMSTKDLDPEKTRLDVAREAADRFVAGRPDDRIGLIGFARYPDLRCPLTLDHVALRRLLAEVSRVESDGPEDATGIGTAIARAAQILRGSPAASKVVILLTDGEENVATTRTPAEIAPLHAGQLCRDLGIRVYSVAAGLGTRNRAGEWTPVDTGQIRQLSRRTGGRFFEARDVGSMASVYAEIDALEKVAIAEPRFRTVEAFVPFLLAGLALLALGRALGLTWLAVRP